MSQQATAVASEVADVSNRLVATGLAYGEKGVVPWIVAPSPFNLHEAAFDQIEELTINCARYLELIRQLVIEEHPAGQWLVAKFGGSETRIALSKIRRNMVAGGSPMVRPDMHYDQFGRLTVAEIETMIGGLGFATGLRQVYGPSKRCEGIPHAYANMMFGIEAAIRAKRQQKRQVERAESLTVVVLNPASKRGYDAEFQYLGQQLQSYGIDFRLARPNEVEYREDDRDRYFLHQGVRIDLIHRFFRLHELEAECPSSIRVLERNAQRSFAAFVQPWAELLEEKAVFALFHDVRWRQVLVDRLGLATFRLLQEAFPHTWVLDEDTPPEFIAGLKQGHHTLEARAYWLKQSGGTWGCQGTKFGCSLTHKKWCEALDAAQQSAVNEGVRYILQEDRPQRKSPIVRCDGKGGTVTEMLNLRINPFGFRSTGNPEDTRVAEIMVAARHDQMVHGATDTTVLPVQVT